MVAVKFFGDRSQRKYRSGLERAVQKAVGPEWTALFLGLNLCVYRQASKP